MKRVALLLSLIMIASAVLAVDSSVQEEKTLKPSDAYAQYNNALREFRRTKPTEEGYQAKRVELAEQFIARCDASGDLEPAEWVKYGDLLCCAKRTDEARTVYRRVARGEGAAAREASRNVIIIDTEEENWDAVEAGILEHRKHFKPSPDDIYHLSSEVSGLASHYQKEGDLDKALQLVLDEVNSVPFDHPYVSLSLLSSFAETFVEAGRKDECLDLIADIAPKIDAAAEALEAKTAEDDKAGKNTIRRYGSLKRSLESAATRLNLLGAPAPDFQFSNQMNTDITSLKDLRGKVVMIDFWANWCDPCKAAFPGMKDLYEKYRDQGFAIVSVTSFQKFFIDGDINEGLNKDLQEDMAPERELELTKDFVKRYEMTWPVVFSSRSCFDPEYGVASIPTFAIVDRQGVIRAIRVGLSDVNHDFLAEFVPKLLAEEE